MCDKANFYFDKPIENQLDFIQTYGKMSRDSVLPCAVDNLKLILFADTIGAQIVPYFLTHPGDQLPFNIRVYIHDAPNIFEIGDGKAAGNVSLPEVLVHEVGELAAAYGIADRATFIQLAIAVTYDMIEMAYNPEDPKKQNSFTIECPYGDRGLYHPLHWTENSIAYRLSLREMEDRYPSPTAGQSILEGLLKNRKTPPKLQS